MSNDDALGWIVFMAKDMNYSQPFVDERGAAFGRLASRVLETLNDAVDLRRAEGETLSTIADRIGCHKSLLSRILNGTSKNLTLRTISDVLWAVKHEPEDFRADPIENISSNWIHEQPEFECRVYETKTINMLENFENFPVKTFKKTEVLEMDGV